MLRKLLFDWPGDSSLTTACIAAGLFTLPFVVDGGLKIAHDVAIFLAFRKTKHPEQL